MSGEATTEKIIITVVGDGAVGKTALVIQNLRNEFIEDYLPTTYEYYSHEITIFNAKHNLVFRDTAGHEDNDMMLPLNFRDTNYFLLCFSVDKSDNSYENVNLKWIPLLRHYNPKTPIILVGTKLDMRQNLCTHCYTYRDGLTLMKKNGAQAYVECSSKLNIGVRNATVLALKMHLNCEEDPVKIMIVGDSGTGCHCILEFWVNHNYPYRDPIYGPEFKKKEMVIDGMTYKSIIWVAQHYDRYPTMRQSIFFKTDCFLLCFDISSESSYRNVEVEWIQELRRYGPTAPVVLVGTKIDLRSDTRESCLTYEDGENMMRKIKADAYVECSAKTGLGIDDVFTAAIKMGIQQKHFGKLA